MSGLRRVVVTGLGAVNSLGTNVNETFQAMLDGKSGVQNHTDPRLQDAFVKVGARVIDTFDWEKYAKYVPEIRIQNNIMAMAAAMEAVEDADWLPETEAEKERTGVYLGIGSIPPEVIDRNMCSIANNGLQSLDNDFILQTATHVTAQLLGMKFNMQGPSFISVGACSASNISIGEAWNSIRRGETIAMLAGGVEDFQHPFNTVAYTKLKVLTSDYNDDPHASSRPFDKNRSGFVQGAGSGMLMLEDYDHAKSRGAKIYGEILGYTVRQGAEHLSRTSYPGAFRSLQRAFEMSEIPLPAIDLVNCHATGTYADEVEAQVIDELFGDLKPYITAFKGNLGHQAGSATVSEYICTLKCMETGSIPPIINLTDPIDVDINFVTERIDGVDIEYTLKNSFAFGGLNSCLITKKI